jgi:hypothetical protein
MQLLPICWHAVAAPVRALLLLLLSPRAADVVLVGPAPPAAAVHMRLRMHV